MVKTIVAGSVIALIAHSAAYAGVVTTFSYDADLRAGAVLGAVDPDFPAGGLFQITNSRSPEDGGSAFAAATGYGLANPLDFASGASAAGNAVVSVTNSVLVTLTNDSGVASNASLNSLIYGGGVGVALANFAAADCVFGNIAQCGSFLGAPGDTGQFATLVFEATLDGVRLFSGDISVLSNGTTSSMFDGVALTGFGLASGNSTFFTWQDTLLSDVSLGTFAIGQSKDLEFNVSILVGTARGADANICSAAPSLGCSIAQAGFGDPRGGGGVITYSSAPASTPFPLFNIQFAAIDPNPIPLPPALALFPLGLAAIAGARRRWR